MKISELDRELAAKNMAGLWSTNFAVHTPEPPFLWKWQDVCDGLMKTKDSVSIDQAERRVIRLINPNCPTKLASRTLHFTFSIVNPGEIARAHRHTLAAIRFVVPLWQWHRHESAGGDEAILFSLNDRPVIEPLVLYQEEKEGR